MSRIRRLPCLLNESDARQLKVDILVAIHDASQRGRFLLHERIISAFAQAAYAAALNSLDITVPKQTCSAPQKPLNGAAP